MSSSSVLAHYERKQKHAAGTQRNCRESSRAYAIRALNNWLKATLIEDHVQRDAVYVVDLCCGCGSDARKLALSRPDLQLYIGVDLSPASLDEARRRCATLQRPRTAFICVDLSAAILPLPPHADCVMCWFALHYFFKTRATLGTLLHTVVRALRPGGVFIAALTDGDVVAHALAHALAHDNTGGGEMELYTIEGVVPPPRDDDSDLDGGQDGGFGLEYTFSLVDSIDACPEFLAPSKMLIEAAAAVGLECTLQQNFQPLVIENYAKHAELRQRMRVPPVVDDASWRVTRLYKAYVFKKKV